MTEGVIHQRVESGVGDCAVYAEVVTSSYPHGTAVAVVHAKSGHVEPGARRGLIDALLDLPAIRRCGRLIATVPLGDSESLLRLGERCANLSVRAAGTSALVQLDLDNLESEHLA